MDRHKRVPGAKRPLGVSTIMAGGAKGYSGCSISVTQKITRKISELSSLGAGKLRITLLSLLQPYLQENAACLCTNPLHRVSQVGLPGENATLQKHSSCEAKVTLTNRDLLTYQAYFSR